MDQDNRTKGEKRQTEHKRSGFPLWLMIALVLAPLVLGPMWQSSQGVTIFNSEFKALLATG